MNNRLVLSWITGIIVVLGAIWVVWPFWKSIAWAAIIAISVWPLYKHWYQLLGKRPALASTTFTCYGLFLWQAKRFIR